MPLSCSIIRTGEGRVDSVLAPNGSPSDLYSRALESTGSEEDALRLWGTAYAPGFLAYYGDWESARDKSRFPLDANGEPLLSDVVAYVTKESSVIGTLSREEVSGINNLARSAGVSGIEAVSDLIENNLVEDGRIHLTRENMAESGLYTAMEANRLVYDSDARREAEKNLEKVRRHMALEHGDKPEKDAYFFPPTEGSLIPTGRYDKFGKQVCLLDGDVREALAKAHALYGPTRVDDAVSSTGNEALIEAYENDPEAMEQIESIYASLERVPIHEIRDGVESPLDTVERDMRNFAETGSPISPKMDGLLRKAMHGEATPEELKDLERLAADMGIDIAGLSGLYNTDPEGVREIAIALDMSLATLERGDYVLTGQLAEAVRTHLGTEEASETVPINTGGRAVIRLASGINPVDAFSRHGLLEVAPGLYVRANMDINTEEAYEGLAGAAKAMPEIVPKEAYPPRYFKKGHLDTQALFKSEGTQEIVDSFRKYVLSLTDYYNSEQMILARAIIGFPLRPQYTHPSTMQESYDRFRASIGRSVQDGMLNDLYKQRLKSKVERDSLWEDFFKFTHFNPDGSMSLRNAGQEELTRMDLALEGDLRDKVMAYALLSNDPSFAGLFQVEQSEPQDITVDFLYQFYDKNPRLMEETKKEYEMEDNGDIYIKGLYDDIIRMEDRALVKTGETAEGSIYSHPVGTPEEIRKAIREPHRPNIPDGNRIVRNEPIRDVFKVDTESLNLECS